MYARWRNVQDYQAMRQDPGPLPFLEEALAIAKFELGMYEMCRLSGLPTRSPRGRP
jgi:hypothetical protein